MGLGFSLWLKDRLVVVSVIAGACVVIAMWLERWLIIIPVMTHPRLIPYSWYAPTMTEVSITAASAALFTLMVLVFFRLFPIVSIWEVAEQRAIEGAQPQPVEPPVEPDPHAVRHHWGVRPDQG
jgi:Ni/Fe-hydrogenase subunit HybB-like protein